ncbi:hypothetical protein DSCO28_42290 [Desulfosarcina ovata subsp. sediminis]|uniref:Response regulatory domain-containing protein n=1 Tax=Desulfosarcina ovata subsp. sediminis TaxID=885957 RepID=A0A5K7ZTX0_9BACT|nr:response regulator [Desulfosarcina ovata]BBO83663.1 hypothetical protein DSCO28_42290 [Desulfosarcina ovata subsp. sediminis]
MSLPALDLFKADPFRFDLVITDYNMPAMSGDQMARQMLAIRKELPIIVCTGFSELFDSQRAQALGIRQTLMKPMTMEALANTVREVLAVLYCEESITVCWRCWFPPMRRMHLCNW